MDQYIVIAQLIANAKSKYENHRVLKIDNQNPIAPQIPRDYEKIFGPAGLDDCVQYVKEIGQPNWFALTVFQYILIAVVTMTFVVVVSFGAYKLEVFSSDLNLIKTADDGARVLITFLVAVATVAIAFLAILTAMVIREYKERFALAKEVLTLLVGILGTIVGFYFGTASKSNPDTKPPANTTSTSTPTANGNGNGNSNTNRLNPTPVNNTKTNSNSTTHIVRLPNRNEVSAVYEKNRNWKIEALNIRKHGDD